VIWFTGLYIRKSWSPIWYGLDTSVNIYKQKIVRYPSLNFFDQGDADCLLKVRILCWIDETDRLR
jgi:hypothetical protein